ncbi:hypothetical protein [Hahella sp. HN01]|uniref:hypothetical protein n=1 Tax=Hahella sp. HN01 TaxID=2847262 RepID=UPI001C1EDFA2|nr:hypothetical protein [Hahella sp. HN01]MBU6956057.1 hypothetical protein [Hahella sp. HN01]
MVHISSVGNNPTIHTPAPVEQASPSRLESHGLSSASAEGNSVGAANSMGGPASLALSSAQVSAPDPLHRRLDSKDIEGFSSAFKSMKSALEKQGIDPDKTLFVSVGRSPQVLCKYMEKAGADVTYLQLSGLSGKSMQSFDTLSDPAQANRNNYFDSAVLSKLNDDTRAIVTIDVGVSGSSNLAAYNEIKNALERLRPNSDVSVKMATVSPFQNIKDDRINSSALEHADNLFKKVPLDENTRGVHRLLKVQYNSIDKELAFTGKYKYENVDKGVPPPEVNQSKLAAIEQLVDQAVDKYGLEPEPTQRSRPDKEFNPMLMFQKDVDAWKQKQSNQAWKEDHPNLSRGIDLAKGLVVAAAGAGAAYLAKQMIDQQNYEA